MGVTTEEEYLRRSLNLSDKEKITIYLVSQHLIDEIAQPPEGKSLKTILIAALSSMYLMGKDHIL